MSDINKNRKYESFKIPGKKTEEEKGIIQLRLDESCQLKPSLSDEIFYEIEYDGGPFPGVGKFVKKAKPQIIEEPIKDEIRELFGRMRDIARTQRFSNSSSRFFDRRAQNDNAFIFYKQGYFMKDFTDNFEGNAEFSQYFPSYQMMGYEQLRTYFTWRGKVRQGHIGDISLSYAFLYIYELLANIGVENQQEGLDKLMFFWKAFRQYNKFIDKYVLRWLKDYHIYYELPHTFKEFAQTRGIEAYYPELAFMTDSFDLFCSISKYNIKESNFYTDETCKIITDCFNFVMDKLGAEFEGLGMNFDDILFRPTKKLVPWKPFRDALFYQNKNLKKQVVFSENEIYICRNNEWKFSTVITSEKGRQFIGFVMKKMESVLRQKLKFKFKLTANINMINDETIRILANAGLLIEKIVTDAVMEYYAEVTKTVVTIDPASLAKIRQDAIHTQEALIVEEISPTIPLTMEKQNLFADIIEEEASPISDVWEKLKAVLTENELQAIATILQCGDIKAFADKSEVMLEVLIDAINEKAVDSIGDNLMDEDFLIYEDYKEQAEELIK